MTTADLLSEKDKQILELKETLNSLTNEFVEEAKRRHDFVCDLEAVINAHHPPSLRIPSVSELCFETALRSLVAAAKAPKERSDSTDNSLLDRIAQTLAYAGRIPACPSKDFWKWADKTIGYLMKVFDEPPTQVLTKRLEDILIYASSRPIDSIAALRWREKLAEEIIAARNTARQEAEKIDDRSKETQV